MGTRAVVGNDPLKAKLGAFLRVHPLSISMSIPCSLLAPAPSWLTGEDKLWDGEGKGGSTLPCTEGLEGLGRGCLAACRVPEVLTGTGRWIWLGQGTGTSPTGAGHPYSITKLPEHRANQSRTCCVPTLILSFNLPKSQ